MLLGAFVNTITSLLAGVLGILFHRAISKKLTDMAMCGLGLCVVYLGFSGSLVGKSAVITIVSMAFGAVIGQALDLDGKMNRFAQTIQDRVCHGNVQSPIAQAFLTSALVLCVGSMGIVGALNSGLQGDHTILFTKSALDFVTMLIFGSTLGVGVLFSVIVLFVLEGGVTLLASILAPILTANNTINEISCVGSIMILALGLNMLGITKIKIVNLLPALIFPAIFCNIVSLLQK